MELLVAELFKDFIENLDQSGFIDKRSLSYSELLKIGDLSEARRFLLDQYVEEMLRGSFLSWVSEISKKMSIDLGKQDLLKKTNDINHVNETFQRRHLFIHNDGYVNDLYLTKTDENITGHLEKDEQLVNDQKYISDKIALFKKVGIILIFTYAKKKYRKDMEEFFEEFNGLLLKLANNGCIGARHIFKELENEKTLSQSSQLICKVNYYLSFKSSGDFDSVKEELEKFDVEALSTEYKMAKYILLGEKELYFKHFKEFADSIDKNSFFHIVDWPLVKIIGDDPDVKKFISDRIEEIIAKEGSVSDEEHSANQVH